AVVGARGVWKGGFLWGAPLFPPAASQRCGGVESGRGSADDDNFAVCICLRLDIWLVFVHVSVRLVTLKRAKNGTGSARCETQLPCVRSLDSTDCPASEREGRKYSESKTWGKI